MKKILLLLLLIYIQINNNLCAQTTINLPVCNSCPPTSISSSATCGFDFGNTDIRFIDFAVSNVDYPSMGGISQDSNLFMWGDNINQQKMITSFNNVVKPDRGDIIPSPYIQSHPAFDGKCVKFESNYTLRLLLNDDGDLYIWNDAPSILGGTSNNQLVPSKVALPSGASSTATFIDMEIVFTYLDDDLGYGVPQSYAVLTSEGKAYWRGSRGYFNNSLDIEYSTVFSEIPYPSSFPVGFKYIELLDVYSTLQNVLYLKGNDGEVYAIAKNSPYLHGNTGAITPLDMTANSVYKVDFPPGHADVKKITVINNSALAVMTDGKLYGWGEAVENNGGNVIFPLATGAVTSTVGTIVYSIKPQEVELPVGVTGVLDAEFHTAASMSTYTPFFIIANDRKVYGYFGVFNIIDSEHFRTMDKPSNSYEEILNIPVCYKSDLLVSGPYGLIIKTIENELFWLGYSNKNVFTSETYGTTFSGTYSSGTLPHPITHGKYDGDNPNVQNPN